jgi:hypothetical protein
VRAAIDSFANDAAIADDNVRFHNRLAPINPKDPPISGRA